eukprot:437230-Pelagomonas_calceolata.AAC.5
MPAPCKIADEHTRFPTHTALFACNTGGHQASSQHSQHHTRAAVRECNHRPVRTGAKQVGTCTPWTGVQKQDVPDTFQRKKRGYLREAPLVGMQCLAQ